MRVRGCYITDLMRSIACKNIEVYKNMIHAVTSQPKMPLASHLEGGYIRNWPQKASTEAFNSLKEYFVQGLRTSHESSLFRCLKKIQLVLLRILEKVKCVWHKTMCITPVDRPIQLGAAVSFEETKRIVNDERALISLCSNYRSGAINFAALATILGAKTRDGSTPMHYNMHLHSKLLVIIEQLDAPALGELLLMQNNFGATPLHNYESLDDLLPILIQKLDIEELFALLRTQNNFGHTLLHHCANPGALYPLLQEKLGQNNPYQENYGKELLQQVWSIKNSDGIAPPLECLAL